MNKFCKNCGTLLEILEHEVYCTRCKTTTIKDANFKENIQEKTYTHQTTSEFLQTESRPTIDEECPKCGHHKAYYSTQQMRSADEGQTVFYECMKCGHKHKQNT